MPARRSSRAASGSRDTAALSQDSSEAVAAALSSLRPDQDAAVREAWASWASPSVLLAETWPAVPRLSARPSGVAEIDWERLTDAAATSAERRARWVWYDIAAEVVRLVPAGPHQERCAIEATDALNAVTEEDSCQAAAAACRSVVQLIGAPAARLVADMAYSGCRPSTALMEDCLRTVPNFVIGGRVYVT